MRNNNSMLLVALLTFGIIAVTVVDCQTQINTRPIIGIYTEPSEYDEFPAKKYSYIAASYIKYVETAGAQAVFVPYDAPKAYLDDLFSKINGLIFPGGDVSFESPNAREKVFLQNAIYLLNKAKNATDNGDFFPVWGTCLGFQLISYIESGLDNRILIDGYNDTTASIIYNIDTSSRLFTPLSADLLNWVETFPAVYYHHNSGVPPAAYEFNQVLNNNLKITSIGYNSTNYPYVATFEAYNYPIYGSQFHPEKNLFEWKVNAPHDFKSDLVTQYFANFFGNLTRANGHSFPGGVNEESKYLISQFPVYSFNSSSFTAVYILPNYANLNNTESLEYIGQTQTAYNIRKRQTNGTVNSVNEDYSNDDYSGYSRNSVIESIIALFD